MEVDREEERIWIQSQGSSNSPGHFGLLSGTAAKAEINPELGLGHILGVRNVIPIQAIAWMPPHLLKYAQSPGMEVFSKHIPKRSCLASCQAQLPQPCVVHTNRFSTSKLSSLCGHTTNL